MKKAIRVLELIDVLTNPKWWPKHLNPMKTNVYVSTYHLIDFDNDVDEEVRTTIVDTIRVITTTKGLAIIQADWERSRNTYESHKPLKVHELIAQLLDGKLDADVCLGADDDHFKRGLGLFDITINPIDRKGGIMDEDAISKRWGLVLSFSADH